MGRRRTKKALTPQEHVQAILADVDKRLVWFPIKHYSPACAWHVRRLIHALKPSAVLVEGPDDATELIEHIVDVDTRPPLTILSSHVDKKNEYGLNGHITPSDDIPARYRGWWPMVDYAPEYQALKAGHEVGAELLFCDAPLRATIPFHHVRRRAEQRVVNDRHLAENAYFEALGIRQRRRSFEDFWQANFEVGGIRADTRRFMEAVLLFAWCARHVNDPQPEAASASTSGPEDPVSALELDGTIAREQHMKWHVKQALKRHPEGHIVVVTGAFHSVALPLKSTKAKRAKGKADRNSETLLTAHSFRALANLYAMNRWPMYGQRVWESVLAAAGGDDEATEATDVAVQTKVSEDGASDSPAGTSDGSEVSAPIEASPAGALAASEGTGDDSGLAAERGERAESDDDSGDGAPQPPDEFPWPAAVAIDSEPFNTTAMSLSLEVMRVARRYDVAVSTADAIGCTTVARNLATLRRNAEVTLDDLTDAIGMSYIKGAKNRMGPPIHKAMREAFIGHRHGRVTDAAGQAPLFRDFYERCRVHKLDVTGDKKVVRCDVHKMQKHRLKSAFLHQADFLEIPMFHRLDSGGGGWRRNAPAPKVGHYKGPDLATGENMHLITETWGVHWKETVDDRLLELSDRGASVSTAAGDLLGEALVQASQSGQQAADTTKLLLRCAQMMLVDHFDAVLQAVEDAIERDRKFDSLVTALSDFVVLHSYRDAVATQGVERLLQTIEGLFASACLVLPQLANTDTEHTHRALEQLQTLTRIALTFEAAPLDRGLLVEKIREMVNVDDGTPTIRGAGFGILFAFGSTREKVVANELDGYALGTAERVLEAGAFLDGLLGTSKNIFMGSPRLLRAINNVIAQLDWQTFKLLLPDLRRAFTQFIPSEIDDISERVSEEIGIDQPPDPNQPVPEGVARAGAAADARVAAVLDGWL